MFPSLAWEHTHAKLRFARSLMARTRYRIFETEYPYFLTCTVVGWLPLFTRRESVDEILNSWRYLQTEAGLKIYGYVILENHLHCILKAPALPMVVQRFKAHTAKRLIEILESHRATTLLRQLQAIKRKHKTESTHQVWQEGSHPQQICSDDMLVQKLEYIHQNPVKRGYVDDAVHWRYSSARNYAKMPGLIEVVTQWDE